MTELVTNVDQVVDEAATAAAKKAELRSKRERILAAVLPHSLDATPNSSYIKGLLCTTLTIDNATAEALIVEYKRFMLIAATVEHPCSPSAMIDEVWHLHVSEDSENYFGAFCGMLDRIVFHEPRRNSLIDPKAAEYAENFKSVYESLFGGPMNPRFWQ